MTALLSSELRGRGRALEIGVGTGLVALPLAAAGVPLVGLDLSAPMLAKLVEKAGGRPPFPLVVGDATTLPFADDRFGAAVVRHVLHLVPAWRQVVAELVRVVAPGGLVLVSSGQVPEPWHELTDRFMDRVGRPSFADALDSWETGAIVEAFRAHASRESAAPTDHRTGRPDDGGVPRSDGRRHALVDVGGRRGEATGGGRRAPRVGAWSAGDPWIRPGAVTSRSSGTRSTFA